MIVIENATPGVLPHLQVTCASDEGFPIGRWPREVRLGREVLRLMKVHHDEEGDARYATYVGKRTRLRVFND